MPVLFVSICGYTWRGQCSEDRNKKLHFCAENGGHRGKHLCGCGETK